MSLKEVWRRIKRRPGPIYISLAILIIFLYCIPRYRHIKKDQAKKLNPVIAKWKTKIKTLRTNSNAGAALDPESVFRDGPVLKLAQNDSRLLEFIRKHHVFLPSDKPYKFKKYSPIGDPTEDEGRSWEIVYKLLKNKRNGFFIECGANDGELLSNTLVLEKYFGWTGLLIEGDPNMVKKLLTKNRKALVVNLCLSGEPYPQELPMQRDKNLTGITFVSEKNRTSHTYFTAKAVPIFSILSAVDVMFEVDLFSLDIKYFELPVLKTIPFDSVFIKIFVVESVPWNARKVIPFLQSKGYFCLHYIFAAHTADYVFIHASLYEKEMLNLSQKGCYIDDDKKFLNNTQP